MPVFHQVAELTMPQPEPWAVLRIDTDDRTSEGKVLGVLVSFHMTEIEAETAASSLSGDLH